MRRRTHELIPGLRRRRWDPQIGGNGEPASADDRDGGGRAGDLCDALRDDSPPSGLPRLLAELSAVQRDYRFGEKAQRATEVRRLALMNAARKAGATTRDIAAACNITPDRVRQVMSLVVRTPGKPGRPRRSEPAPGTRPDGASQA